MKNVYRLEWNLTCIVDRAPAKKKTTKRKKKPMTAAQKKAFVARMKKAREAKAK